jgi:hypothetical protein
VITFLCIDPLLKGVYILRCFYGESLQTGQDLKAELKSFSAPAGIPAAALILLLCFSPLMASGADTLERDPNAKPDKQNAVASPDLNRSIDEVIQQREYSWRLPREGAPKVKDESELSAIERFFKSIESGFKALGRWIKDWFEWLDRQGGRRPGTSLDGLSLAGVMKGLLVLLVVALAGLIIWLLVRLWRNQGPALEVAAEALPAAPDVSDENVGADQLPEDGWIRLARELLERGELRLALRALYLAALAHLAERNLITLAKYKSNRDYERELLRRGHALAEVPGLFSQSVSAFERVWYGRHGVSRDLLDEFARNVERIKAAG